MSNSELNLQDSVRDADHSACNACGVSCTQRQLEQSSTNVAHGTHRYVTIAERRKKKKKKKKKKTERDVNADMRAICA